MTTTTTTATADDLRAEGITTGVPRAAEYLGVSRAFAYEMAKNGTLPTIKLGPRRVRVPTAALADMLGVEL
ncbi:helix-turn-helix transcriptional regulator [[Mycobacterium] crassicus]|nr:helix-turn-helix domain-containing protein [Mycolicibacter sp. MYC098]